VRRAGFTTRASCLIAAGLTALICGLALGIVDLARAGVLAVAVPLISAVVVLRSQVQLANRRTADPARAAAGQTVTVNLTMSNRSVLSTGPLMLEDQLPAQLRGQARFVLDGLHSRESRTVSYRMPRLPRGRYRAGPLHIRLTDPFHLVDVRRSFTATNDIVVAPIVEALPDVEPPRSVDVGENVGSHSIGARGADDASTREYRTGDDLRKIHWRSSARLDTLMVRQEERPWQGQITVLLDLRERGHADLDRETAERREYGDPDGSAGNVTGSADDRLRSSLEWAISAAASIGTHALVAGRDLVLLDDPGAPTRRRVATASQLTDHLSTVRASPKQDLTGLQSALTAEARESTIIAVVGDLDPASLRVLAGVHPRGSSTAALAMVLDTGTWDRGPGAPASPDTDPCYVAARVLRAAGWQVRVVRCGDRIDESWRALVGFGGLAAGVR